MLVDPETGRLSQSSHRAIATARSAADAEREGGEKLEQELFLAQLETNSMPCATLAELRSSIIRGRREAVEAATNADCAVAAVATPVLGWAREEQTTTPKPRYQHIVNEFGDTTTVVCGMHVHVSVDEDEAIPVLDHLRPWLPVLSAISVNSPFNSGRDTGHASWRSHLWGGWPTAGPAEPFGDRKGYEAATRALMDSGAAMDKGMLYLDARPAEAYPTVEMRVADVCTDIGDALLIAGLTRALVATVAEHVSRGVEVPEWRTDLLRSARWRASRYGMTRDLVHPLTRSLARPREVMSDLVLFVGDALDDVGDRADVLALINQLFTHGTGATRQRKVAEVSGTLEAVVKDLRERTAAGLSD